MTCEDLRQRLNSYAAGRLPDADIEALDDHIDRCEDCTALVSDCLATAGGAEAIDEHQELLRLVRLPAVPAVQARAGMDAVLSELHNRRAVAAQASDRSVPPIEARNGPSRSAPPRTHYWPRRAYGYSAAAVVVAALGLMLWNQHGRAGRAEQQLLALESRDRALESENAALRRDLARAASSTRPPSPNTPRGALEQRAATLVAENQRLKRLLARRGPIATPGRGVLATLHDGGKVVVVERAGAVRVVDETDLPPSLAQAVRALVEKGSAPPTQRVAMAMATLRFDETNSALRSAREGEKPLPVPLNPVLTAVRSPQATLRWRAIPGAQQYAVRVAYPEEKESGKVIWYGSAGPKTEITVPAGTLRRGQLYFWQVEAIVAGESRLSPAVGFWVLDARTLRRLGSLEKKHPDSALVRAAVLEANGVYDEARALLERLAASNPDSPRVRVMLEQLDRRTGGAEPRPQ